MTPAVEAVRRAAVSYELHRFEVEPGMGYGECAAAALNVPQERVFKTLIASIDGNRLVVALVCAGTELNLRSLAAVSGGKKAELAHPADAQRSTGYVLGGISPFGQRRRLATYIDASALGYPTIFVSAGRRGLELEISPTDLISLSEAVVGTIAR